MAGKALERGKAVHCRKLTDRIHSGMKVERGEPEAAIAYLGNALPHFTSYLCERVFLRHYRASD